MPVHSSSKECPFDSLWYRGYANLVVPPRWHENSLPRSLMNLDSRRFIQKRERCRVGAALANVSCQVPPMPVVSDSIVDTFSQCLSGGTRRIDSANHGVHTRPRRLCTFGPSVAMSKAPWKWAAAHPIPITEPNIPHAASCTDRRASITLLHRPETIHSEWLLKQAALRDSVDIGVDFRTVILLLPSPVVEMWSHLRGEQRPMFSTAHVEGPAVAVLMDEKIRVEQGQDIGSRDHLVPWFKKMQRMQ